MAGQIQAGQLNHHRPHSLGSGDATKRPVQCRKFRAPALRQLQIQCIVKGQSMPLCQAQGLPKVGFLISSDG